MLVTLDANEIARALEAYFNTIYRLPVQVISLDFAGMRSKEGINVTVEIRVEGEHKHYNLTVPAMPYIKSNKEKDDNELPMEIPTSESSLQDALQTDSRTKFNQVIKLLSNNPLNKNGRLISQIYVDALNQDENLAQALDANDHFAEWKERYYSAENSTASNDLGALQASAKEMSNTFKDMFNKDESVATEETKETESESTGTGTQTIDLGINRTRSIFG